MTAFAALAGIVAAAVLIRRRASIHRRARLLCPPGPTSVTWEQRARFGPGMPPAERARAARLPLVDVAGQTGWRPDRRAGSLTGYLTGWLTGLVGLAGRLTGWLGLTGRSDGDDVDHALVLEAVARPLRTGASLVAALEEAGRERPDSPAARDLVRAMAVVGAGGALADALGRWRGDDPSRGRALAATALALAAEVGGSPSRPLDDAAAGLRDRAALAAEVHALSSQARASAVVMVAGPPAFLAVASTFDHRLVHTLLATPAGAACLVAGVALDLVGAAWMARLVRSVS